MLLYLREKKLRLPDSVDLTLNNNTTTSAAVTWDGGSPTYDGDNTGTYSFIGTILLPSGVINPNNLTASVVVNVKEKIISHVEVLNDIWVDYGTISNQIGLPDSVNITLNINNTTTSAAVTWDDGDPTYNNTTPGTYTFTGTIALPSGVNNPNDVKANVNVIVDHLNLAFNKDAKASSFYDSNQAASKAVDGSIDYKWCTTNPGDNWLKLDLGRTCTIGRWIVRHAHAGLYNGSYEPDTYNTRDFKLQTSVDGQNNWVDIDSVTGNAADM